MKQKGFIPYGEYGFYQAAVGLQSDSLFFVSRETMLLIGILEGSGLLGT